MASNPLFVLLCSGEHEKLQMAAMIASIGAVSDRPVQVFVSMNASLAFAKDTPADKRYQGGAFSKLLKEKHAPDALKLFQQGMVGRPAWVCVGVVHGQSDGARTWPL